MFEGLCKNQLSKIAARNGLNDLEYFGAKWDLSEYYSEDRLEKQQHFQPDMAP